MLSAKAIAGTGSGDISVAGSDLTRCTGRPDGAQLSGLDARGGECRLAYLIDALEVFVRVKQFRLRRFFLSIGCVLLVRALEVFDTSAVEMPDPGRHFLDEVMIVRH
jgi:hypothetical protein